MKYTIDIIDTTDSGHAIVYEYAEKSSIILSYNGADEKGVQNKIGSSLSFSMEVNVENAVDGHFIHLFTGNEKKYKVRLYLTDTDETVWVGHLLPDTYSEPYTNGTFYPNFTATDGLGTLTGKYLSDDFYVFEKSVIEYISEILGLTNLNLPIYVAPAILNRVQKDYNQIYLDGRDFLDKGKKKNAGVILQEILSSMLCEVYQANNRWYVEGFNHRHKKSVNYRHYSADGTFIGGVNRGRLVKNFTGLDIPMVSIVSPYGRVEVSQERRPQALPETIAEEENDGWRLTQGMTGAILPTHWVGNGGYFPKAVSPDYQVALYTREDAFDDSKFLSLKNPIYVSKYQRLVFRAEFKSVVEPTQDELRTIENGIKIRFILNGGVIYEVEKSFTEKDLIFSFDLFIQDSGVLDLLLFQPFSGGDLQSGTLLTDIEISKMELSVMGFEKESVHVLDLENEYTKVKEFDLVIGDDSSGFSRSFLMSKIRSLGLDYTLHSVDVQYGFTANGKNYSVVSLYGANLIADNIDSVYYSGSLLEGLEVIYNYQKGEQMVVVTPTLINSGVLDVRRYKVDVPNSDRSSWEIWSDSFYPIETDRYNVAVAKVLSRLFPVPFEKVEFVCDAAYNYNDLINFNFMLPRDYYILKMDWSIDAGETSGVMVRALYQDDIVDYNVDNIPPIVNAGSDVILPQNFGEIIEPFGRIEYFHTTAEAYDPDGFISSYKWGVASGDVNALIKRKDKLAPMLSYFEGQEITLILKVVDNEGATANDTVTFYKRSVHEIGLTETINFYSDWYANLRHDVTITPELPLNTVITIKGVFINRTIARLFGAPATFITIFSVYKNGIEIIKVQTAGVNQSQVETGDFEFNYMAGDNINIQMQFSIPDPSDGFDGSWYKWPAEFEITTVIFQSGGGEVTGYPIGKKILHPTFD
jgi:hypothetical protein